MPAQAATTNRPEAPAATAPLGRAERWWRLLLVALFGAALAGLALGAGAYVPPCGFRALSGEPCLLCGGTRSSVALVRGDLTTALDWHRLGPATLALLLVQLLCWSAEAGFARRFWPRLQRAAWLCLLVALLGYWPWHQLP